MLDALMLMVTLCNCAVVLFILCVTSFVSFYFCTSYPLLLYVLLYLFILFVTFSLVLPTSFT